MKTDVSDGKMKELNTRLSCAKRPAWPIWRRKHKIDWLHACAISRNLCCDDLVESTVKPFLWQGVHKTLIFRSQLPGYQEWWGFSDPELWQCGSLRGTVWLSLQLLTSNSLRMPFTTCVPFGTQYFDRNWANVALRPLWCTLS